MFTRGTWPDAPSQPPMTSKRAAINLVLCAVLINTSFWLINNSCSESRGMHSSGISDSDPKSFPTQRRLPLRYKPSVARKGSDNKQDSPIGYLTCRNPRHYRQAELSLQE